MRRSMQRWIALAAITLFMVLPMLPASAYFDASLFRFKGKVTDQIGRSLPDVTVSDGNNSVKTASDGTYILGETSLGTYTLTASRSDLVSVSRQATVTNPKDLVIDFVMPYKASASLSRQAVSTDGVSAALTLEVSSHAPLPGTPGQTGGRSCVTASDTRSGEEVYASYVSSTQGVSLFRATFNLPADTEEGEHVILSTVVDCASDVLLSKAPAVIGYTIDNTDPSVDARTVLPPDGGHTAFTSQPIMAEIHDGGVGVDHTSVGVTVTDETSGIPIIVASFSSADLSFDQKSSRITTPSVALLAGRTYRTAITVADLAGNELAFEQLAVENQGGFGVLDLDLTTAGTTASIASTPCSLGPVSGSWRTAVCSGVDLALEAVTFGASGLRHGGHGALLQTVPLTGAYLRSGEGETWRDPFAGAGWQQVEVAMLYEVPADPASEAAISAAAASHPLETLSMSVPADWSSALIEMPSVQSAGTSVAACAVPGEASYRCGPDPVLMFSELTVASGTYQVDTDGNTSIVGLSAEKQLLDTNGNVAATEAVPVSAQPQAAGAGEGSDGFGECPDVQENSNWKPYLPWEVTLEEPNSWSQYVVSAWSHKQTDTWHDDAGNEVQRRMWGLCSSGITDATNGYRTTQSGTIITNRNPTLTRDKLRYVTGPDDCDDQGATWRLCEITIGFKGKNFTAGVTISIHQGFHHGGAGPGPMQGITSLPTKNMAHAYWDAQCNWWTEWRCGVQEAVGTAIESRFRLEPEQPASVKAEFPVQIFRTLNCGKGCEDMDTCKILCWVP